MSDKKIFIISVLMCMLLGLSTYLYGRKVERITSRTETGQSFSFAKIDENIASLDFFNEIEDFFTIKEDIQYREFVILDNKLKMEYPSYWEKVGDLHLTEAKNEEIFEAIFFASYIYIIDNTHHPVILSIRKTDTKEGLLREIREEHHSFDFLSVEEEDEYHLLKRVHYSTAYSQSMFSKEKVFFLGEDTVIVSIFASDKLWEKIGERLNYTMNSIVVEDN